MHLSDQVIEARRRGSSSRTLPSADIWAGAILAAPVRYILSDEVRDECIALASVSPALVEPTPQTPRIPHETMWVEWRDPSGSSLNDGRPGRVGVLVESEAGGRSGTAHMIYESDEGPVVAQLRIAFDFDSSHAASSELVRIAYPGEDPDRGIGRLMRHFQCDFEAGWGAYFEQARREGKLSREMVADMARTAVPDFVFLCAFLVLLGVERVLDGRPSDLERLNRARVRAGRQPLLDHVSVHLSLAAKTVGQRGSGSRTAARLHQVRGHLVRRAGKIFWRSNHLRGDPTVGAIASRTIRVTR